MFLLKKKICLPWFFQPKKHTPVSTTLLIPSVYDKNLRQVYHWEKTVSKSIVMKYVAISPANIYVLSQSNAFWLPVHKILNVLLKESHTERLLWLELEI